MVGRQMPRERERFLFAAVFSRSAGRGGSVVFFVRVLCCLNAPRSVEGQLYSKKAYRLLMAF